MYSCRRIYYSYAHRFQFIYEPTHVHVSRVNTSAEEEKEEEGEVVEEVEEEEVEQQLDLLFRELSKDLETLNSAQSNL